MATATPLDDGVPWLEPAGPTDRWALSGLSMRVEPGQFAAIVRPSGSG